MELKVFITTREVTCSECGSYLGTHAWIVLTEDAGALCLACADLDHLLFLSAGDAALTRRAGKYSTLSSVVLKWSRARKRYERQGILVESDQVMLFDLFAKYEAECKRLLGRDLSIPAYDYCLKCSHTFNLLEARGAISVTERAG